jgi:cell division septation protein DedD
MARNNDGEFEMILGNKQLLSMFFLVVVLFGVFFSLGFMVGKSVGPGQTLAAQPAATEPAPSSESRPSPARPPATDTAPLAKPVEAAQTEPVVKFEPSRTPAPRPAEKTETPTPLVVRDIHLQLAAVRVKEDAEALVETLRKKGYAVQLNSQTRDGWHRVVVGPFPTERAAQDMKAKLEKDGYKSILKKP